jgi:alpha-tubulin suppressor-like RCC1 family protein
MSKHPDHVQAPIQLELTRHKPLTPIHFRSCGLLAVLLSLAGVGSPLAAVLVATGANNFGQTSSPSAPSSPYLVEAGWDFNVSIGESGEVDVWGRQLPPQQIGPVVAVAAGMRHSLALLADGKVTGWGSNLDGIIDIPGNLPPAMAVAAGAYHSLALLRDGTVRAWGFRGNDRTLIPNDLRQVTAISAGRDHSIALKADGTAVAWGLNDRGQTTVPPSLTGLVAIAAGGSHNLALRADGTVVAWGDNDFGQATVPAGLQGVVAIAAGLNHSLALLTDGTIRGWGSNSHGQLNFSGTGYTAISAGATHSTALRGGPMLTSQPLGQSAIAGNEVTLHAQANDPDATYQWFLDGVAIAGAHSSSLVLSAVGRRHAGSYSVAVTNAAGTTHSQSATLAVRGRANNRIHHLASQSITIEVSDSFGDPITPATAGDYQLMGSDNLRDWLEVPATPVHQDGKLYFTEQVPDNSQQRYYRVEQN